MPSSTYRIINETIENVLKIRPASVLDVGIGFGKYGFLIREYLECWADRVFVNQWEIKLDGIEIFKPYTEFEWNQKIYDNIIVGDASKVEIKNYDLIICMDMIEHVDKISGIMLLEQIIEKSNKATIINVPLKNWMNNVIVANNPHEAHQAIWEENDLNEIASRMDVNLEKVIWKQNNRCGCLGIFKK